MHARFSENRKATTTKKSRRKILDPLPSKPPSTTTTTGYGLDIAEEGILKIMDNSQGSNCRSSRLPPLSARTQRTGAGRGGQSTGQRSSPNGHLYKGTTSMRIRSAKVNGTSPSYDMIVTGQNLTNGNGNSNGYITSRFDDRSHSFILDTEQGLITTYLKANPAFLDRYVMKHVGEDVIERWLGEKRFKRNRIDNGDSSTPTISGENLKTNSEDDLSKMNEKMDVRKFMQDLTSDVKNMSSVGKLLQHLASYIAKATNCDDYTVYLMDVSTQGFRLYSEASNLSQSENENESGISEKDHDWSTVKHLDVSISSSSKVSTPGGAGVYDRPCNILSLPVLDLMGRVMGTIQLYRMAERKNFTEEDKRICDNFIGMSGLLLKCQELYVDMGKQRQLNEFLLTVTKSIFQDIVSMDTVIVKTMNYAKRLVNADRTALFLVDRKTEEIYATVFDSGEEEQKQLQESAAASGSNNNSNKQQNEIRFSVHKGVAGYVAATGQTLNIPDAYADERFNREIDLLTGYKTKSILCMPLCIRGKTIGVVQMVNKRDGIFTKRDEESFEVFAVYCALALHHAKLYEKIRRSEQRNKVALEVLSYHSQSTEDEMNQLMQTPIPKEIPELIDYNFSPWDVPSDEKPLLVLYMFRDLFQQSRFDLARLSRFTLTVRKNYRNVPYHNWSHAFSVAQSIYLIMKNVKTRFTLLEGLALFVACLCHDVDHRGYTNQFMVNTSSPLASLYSTSTMEHHHFNHTITILQQEGHNIFTYLTSEEYKQVLSDIKEFILATDLAVFFANKGRLREIMAKEAFDWNSKEQRQLGLAISMTACDLSSSSKPWNIQMGVVEVIFEEFYAQGDKEKAAGKTPMTMMDRDRRDQLPVLQAGFLAGICVPCYELLADILPETKPMLEGARANLKSWQAQAEKEKEKEAARLQQKGKEEGRMNNEHRTSVVSA